MIAQPGAMLQTNEDLCARRMWEYSSGVPPPTLPDTHDTLQCKQPSPQKKGAANRQSPPVKTIIPAPPTDARENRVLSPCLTHSCVFSRHPRGFIIPAFIPLSQNTPGLSFGAGERDDLSGSQNKEESMSRSGLDRERKCGASGGEGRGCGRKGNVGDVRI